MVSSNKGATVLSKVQGVVTEGKILKMHHNQPKIRKAIILYSELLVISLFFYLIAFNIG